MLKDVRLWGVYDLDRKDVIFASVSQNAARNVLQRSMSSMPFCKFTLLRFDLSPLYSNADDRSSVPAVAWSHSGTPKQKKGKK